MSRRRRRSSERRNSLSSRCPYPKRFLMYIACWTMYHNQVTHYRSMDLVNEVGRRTPTTTMLLRHTCTCRRTHVTDGLEISCQWTTHDTGVQPARNAEYTPRRCAIPVISTLAYLSHLIHVVQIFHDSCRSLDEKIESRRSVQCPLQVSRDVILE